jgi:hypothetical protein
MMALVHNTSQIFYNIAKAESLAKELNATDEEGWNYVVKDGSYDRKS